MMTFIANGIMWNGMLAGHRDRDSAHEIWVKKWGGKGKSTGGDRRWGKMKKGKMRTCAIVARSLYAERKRRGSNRDE